MDDRNADVKDIDVSIIIPCLNEEECIGRCIDTIKDMVEANDLNVELIVVDNGSTDGSQEIIKSKLASFGQGKVVFEQKRGYGAAYLRGISEARGKYLFLADSDNTYDFREMPRFMEAIKSGKDLVLGNRFGGTMEKGAMPFANRYIGNPILSGMLRLFFFTKVKDSHSGMRAITRDAVKRLNLKTTGMEFASEMIIKSLKNKLRIQEIPINYHKRGGHSKLRPMRDAWRHVKFMLLYSPLFLFMIPGAISFCLGLFSMVWLYIGSAHLFGITFDYHPMFLSSLFILVGYQLMIFCAFAQTYAIYNLDDDYPFMRKILKVINLENSVAVGGVISIIGFGVFLYIFAIWVENGLSNLHQIKNSIVALTLVVLGIQTIFSSFMLDIVAIRGKQD